MLIALSMLRIPRVMPENYARAVYKLNKFWRGFFCWGLFVTSAIFFLIGVVDSPVSTAIYFSCLALGIVYYFIRKWMLSKQGIDLRQLLIGEKDFPTGAE